MSASAVTPPRRLSSSPSATGCRSADADCCRNAITRRIQSTKPMPRCPSGAGRSLKSRCTWALTSPGRMATLPRSRISCDAMLTRMHRKRRFARLRCSPRRRKSDRRRRETRSGRGGLFAYAQTACGFASPSTPRSIPKPATTGRTALSIVSGTTPAASDGFSRDLPSDRAGRTTPAASRPPSLP